MATLIVIVGGQYGSEGKGAVAGWLGEEMSEHDLAIRVAGPNAGHTVIDANGCEWKLRAVPVAAAVSGCRLQIAAGSEVDVDVLLNEVAALDEAGYRVSERLRVHPAATWLQPRHIQRETEIMLSDRIGSTGKGIGAARADRIMRTAHTAAECDMLRPLLGDWIAQTRAELNSTEAYETSAVLIEGTQGYGLGLHHDNYPQVTSSNCRAIDFLAMAGISPWEQWVDDMAVIVTARAYPIRVAGNSGPMLGETTWEALGLPPERTTVTQKIRRVGEWDVKLIQDAVIANGGGASDDDDVVIALTMVDQVFPQIRDNTEVETWPQEVHTWIKQREADSGARVAIVGVGPRAYVAL